MYQVHPLGLFVVLQCIASGTYLVLVNAYLVLVNADAVSVYFPCSFFPLGSESSILVR